MSSSAKRFQALVASLRVPVVQAPMFLISGPEMVIAACRAGIVGSFPTQNARCSEQLQEWLETIAAAVRQPRGSLPWAVNLIVHPTYERREADLQLLTEYRAPLVITALGDPAFVIDSVKAYGGLVFADVTTPELARKAVRRGVDGLVLVCAGAGGHTGQLSPFVFVDEVRSFWDGPFIVAGGIGSGRAINAALALGADLAYLGTRFLATEESMAAPAYKQMVVDSSSGDIVCSDAITGARANWLRDSLLQAGYDPNALQRKADIDVSSSVGDAKRWRDIWSAGQTVATVSAVEPLASVVASLEKEMQSAAVTNVA